MSTTNATSPTATANPRSRTFKKLTAGVLAAAIAAGICFAASTGSPGTASPTATAGPRSGSIDTPAAGAGSGQRSSATPAGTEGAGIGVQVLDQRTMGDDNSSGVIDSQMIHRPGQAVSGTDTGKWTSWDDFMSWALNDAAAVWNWYYQQWGLNKVSSVHYVFPNPGQSVATANCGATDDTTMMYCPNDDTIYFSKALASNLWTGAYTGNGGKNIGGDFAVVAMLAHEYGHNVQDELTSGGHPALVASYGVPKVEQDADCYSGAFARIAYYQGVLDSNDVNEGLWTMYAVGDKLFERADHHGTPDERVTAWKLGYNSAGPAACDAILNG